MRIFAIQYLIMGNRGIQIIKLFNLYQQLKVGSILKVCISVWESLQWNSSFKTQGRLITLEVDPLPCINSRIDRYYDSIFDFHAI